MRRTMMIERPVDDTPITVSLALLSLRIGLGVVFMFHGAQKLFSWFGGQGLAGMIEGFGPVLAYLIGIGEFFGGLGLLVGILTRFSAASLIVIMMGAIVLVHAKNGFPAPKGFEYPFTLVMMLIPLLLCGPGKLAISAMLPPSLRRWVG